MDIDTTGINKNLLNLLPSEEVHDDRKDQLILGLKVFQQFLKITNNTKQGIQSKLRMKELSLYRRLLSFILYYEYNINTEIIVYILNSNPSSVGVQRRKVNVNPKERKLVHGIKQQMNI